MVVDELQLSHRSILQALTMALARPQAMASEYGGPQSEGVLISYLLSHPCVLLAYFIDCPAVYTVRLYLSLIKNTCTSSVQEVRVLLVTEVLEHLRFNILFFIGILPVSWVQPQSVGQIIDF